MDTKGWVLEAVRKLGWATEKEIQRYLDEEGEPLSRKELRDALDALAAEGKLEQKNDLYRIAALRKAREAFERLFEDPE
ncbi:hypothetical protein [Marinithermus hydrothermalis]|uniref:Uncharacterized protein n=1 Tax=Marinithermus hydrothermalis (strain DSM 14884 / JCM 11576 / T1) TaxID=869210 RepID=F2NNE7_MARHT|nr:hypothetical protein [Marinithermus hydrothermalis]AEB10988.1 hypothetical protein Marky_0227 [Marinithermus hydrothermalis DSM 14884]